MSAAATINLSVPKTGPPAAGLGLSPQQLEELAAANRLLRKIMGAAKTAAFNGYCSATFALLSLPFVWGSWSTAFICAGLGVVAYRELRGRRMLLKLEAGAPKLLAGNQLLLMAVLVAYGAWQLMAAQVSPPELPAELNDPQIKAMLGGIEELVSLATLLVYGCLIVGAIIFQGLTARYYARRGRMLAEYLARTPAWVRQVQGQMVRR